MRCTRFSLLLALGPALPASILVAATLARPSPAVAQAAYKPGPDNVVLPADYQQRFVRYAVIDRADRKIVRFMYVSPEAFAAVKKDAAFPDGTVLIMEDHAARLDANGAPMLDQQGRFIPQPAVTGIFVQEKRQGWGEGYPDAKRNGDWEFARFNPDATRHPGPVEARFTCHKPRSTQDYTFTLWDYAQARR